MASIFAWFSSNSILVKAKSKLSEKSKFPSHNYGLGVDTNVIFFILQKLVFTITPMNVGSAHEQFYNVPLEEFCKV